MSLRIKVAIKREPISEDEAEEEVVPRLEKEECSLMVENFLPYAVSYRNPNYPWPTPPYLPYDDDFCTSVVRMTMEYRMFFFSVVEDHYDYFKETVDAFWEVFYSFGKGLVGHKDDLVDDRHVCVLLHFAGVVATVYVSNGHEQGYQWVAEVLTRFLNVYVTERLNLRGGYPYFAQRIKKIVPGNLYEHCFSMETDRAIDMKSLKEKLSKLASARRGEQEEREA